MAFWTPSGLKKLAQSESGGRADLIHYPSGYTRSGVRSSASGLYGFLDTTWQQQAQRAGVDTSQYPRAYMAPADVQTYVASQTPTSHWTCPGCNNVASGMAGSSQYVSATPATAISGDGGSYGDYGRGGSPGGDPNYGITGTPYSGGTGLTIDPENDPGPGPSASPYSDAGGAGSGYDADLGGGGGSVPSGEGSGFDADLGGLAGAAAGLAGGGSGGKAGGLRELYKAGKNTMVQVGLIVLGIILIAAAAWKLAQDSA